MEFVQVFGKFSLSYWKNTKKQDFTGRNSTLSVAEQLFITLLWLQHMASTFLNWLIFTKSANIRFLQFLQPTWMFLFNHFQTMKFMIFPEGQAYGKTLSKVFWPFKNIRASINCAEFKCEMPRNYSQQGNRYSSYKSHCTMKYLIAVNPNGAACFVSDLFEGSISDVIFEKFWNTVTKASNHFHPTIFRKAWEIYKRRSYVDKTNSKIGYILNNLMNDLKKLDY